MAIIYDTPSATFFTILADGQFHKTVDAGTPGAVLRTYDTSTGGKGEKWELVARAIEGKITNITVHEGEYGKSLNVAMDVEGEKDVIIISMNLASNYAEDFLKKLPNIDIDKNVTIAPYNFEDGGKNKRGVTIKQGNNKLTSYYHKSEDIGGGKFKTTIVNGYPEPEGDTKKYDSDDWKMYFTKSRKFMVAELEKHALYNLPYLTTKMDVKDELPIIEYSDGDFEKF